MTAVVAFVAGALVTRLLWYGLEPQWRASAVLRRANYRDAAVPVAAGVVVVLGVVLVGAAYLVVAVLDGLDGEELRNVIALTSTGALGFGFIGLVDDLVGATSTKGFRGHLGAIAGGEVTTGLVKLVWGVLVAALLVPYVELGDPPGLVDLGRAGLLIAASANAGNLFDRAPGRVIKVGVVMAVVIVGLGAPAAQLAGPLLVLGAGAGLLVPDLRERCMLGDTGSNVLGGAAGVGLVVSLGATGEWVALAAAVAVNLVSEAVSFSAVIDRSRPLRWLDRAGTLPERRAR